MSWNLRVSQHFQSFSLWHAVCQYMDFGARRKLWYGSHVIRGIDAICNCLIRESILEQNFILDASFFMFNLYSERLEALND
jgi:hypothetical protein